MKEAALFMLAALVFWAFYEVACAFYVLRKLHAKAITIAPPPGLIGYLVTLGAERRIHTRARVERLRATLRGLRQLMNSWPDAICVLDQHGQILWHNRSASLWFTIEKRRFTEALSTPDSFSIVEWLRQNQDFGPVDYKPPNKPELRLMLKRDVLESGRQILIARDVTALSRLQQVRQDFVANVSHELRTPLTVLNGYLDLIEPEELAEFAPIVVQMRAQSKRMVNIVDDLLTLSRLDRASNVSSEQLLMAELLKQLVLDANALSQGRHAITLHDELAMDLVGSEHDLRSAFSNLVSNAVRYTPTNGVISIRWSWHEAGAQFQVEDNGYGIPAEHIPRLTERFYRVSNSRSRDSGGTGLGLAIVNHCLELHQARLEIESELGKGSRFRCVLPRDRLRYRDVR